MTISARIADDLTANAFESRHRFEIVASQPGGTACWGFSPACRIPWRQWRRDLGSGVLLREDPRTRLPFIRCASASAV